MVSDQVVLALEVGVEDLDGLLQLLDGVVVDVSLNKAPPEGGLEDEQAGSPDVGLDEVDPLVDLSGLVVANASQFGVWVESGEVSGDGGTLEDGALACLEAGELSGKAFLLVFLGFLLLLGHDDFLNLDVGQVGGDDGDIGEEVSGVVVVDFL